MPQPHEAILAEIPGSSSDERMLVVHRQVAGQSQIELRQQTWGEGIGWFTQGTMRLEPQQVAQLRGVLGGQSPCPSATLPLQGRPSQGRPVAERPELRIHAESA